MGYREENEALRARLEVAERARAEAEARAARAERAAAGEPSLAGLEGDLGYRLARIALASQGALWFVAVLVFTPVYLAMGYADRPFDDALPPLVQGLVMAAVLAAFVSPPAIAAGLAWRLLPRNPRAGFTLALVAAGLGILWWPCLPLGVVVFVGLLRPHVRQAFFPPR